MRVVHQVFQNAEIIRVADSARKGYPGLFASINDVTDGAEEIPCYISAAGVDAGLSFERIDRTDVITPYGAYGLMLHNLSVGLCWYNNMLAAPRMQGAYGSTEAVNVNGTEISPLTTWDSKITTVLAMLGGIGPLVARGMQRDLSPVYSAPNAYEEFLAIVGSEHARVFDAYTSKTDQGPVLQGNDVPYALPTATVPAVLSEWGSC